MYIGVFLHVCLHDGIGSAGIGIADSCELPSGFWELNPGPLEEQPVLLTVEPSLQCLPVILKKKDREEGMMLFCSKTFQGSDWLCVHL